MRSVGFFSVKGIYLHADSVGPKLRIPGLRENLSIYYFGTKEHHCFKSEYVSFPKDLRGEDFRCEETRTQQAV